MLGQTNSFDFNGHVANAFKPLASILRPINIDDYIGQEHILGEGKPLRTSIKNGQVHSMIFWGPPGTGKTTLAEIIAGSSNVAFERVSAVTSGVKDIRAAIDRAQKNTVDFGKRTIVFVDEVHRFNKSQQDAFLPFIENGTITFIGATTENPAFELNQALLSRAKVYTLKKLNEKDLDTVLKRALVYCRKQEDLPINIAEKAMEQLVSMADGDARRLLNLLENVIEVAPTDKGFKDINLEALIAVAGDKVALYDKNGDAFYDLISAFHKSVRGSDPNAALYWYARILTAGGEPLYVARRLLAIASEDIGNADPRALEMGLNAWDIFHRVGPKEGERAIAQAAVYMALAPKSNAIYQAFNNAKSLAIETSSLDVPMHLKNATSKLTEGLGHGAGYRYAHNEENGFAAGETYLPKELIGTELYQPTNRGFESRLQEIMQRNSNWDINSETKRN